MGIQLSGARCEEIKRTVVSFFEKYDVACVPISGFEIAVKMGVSVVPYSAKPESTQRLMLKESKDGFTAEDEKGNLFIFYNEKKGYGRINNTIMHEIGHIVLDHSEGSELAEVEARFFAKYALAPPPLIHKLRLQNPMQIADVFDISQEAARYAYQYYQKWLQFGSSQYTEYENRMLRLFKEVG